VIWLSVAVTALASPGCSCPGPDRRAQHRVLDGQLLARAGDRGQRVGQTGGAGGAELAQQRAVEHVDAFDGVGVAAADLVDAGGLVVGGVLAQAGQQRQSGLGLLQRRDRGRVELAGPAHAGEHLGDLGVGLAEADLQHAAVVAAGPGHVQAGLVALRAQRVGRVGDLLLDLQEPGAAAQVGRLTRLVGHPQHTEHEREHGGQQPDHRELPHQCPVARVQPLGPGTPGLGAGHVNVPLMVAGDDRPNSGTQRAPARDPELDEVRSRGGG
jgi:hypothetical protein